MKILALGDTFLSDLVPIVHGQRQADANRNDDQFGQQATPVFRNFPTSTDHDAETPLVGHRSPIDRHQPSRADRPENHNCPGLNRPLMAAGNPLALSR
jgi:hypothetical protein